MSPCERCGATIPAGSYDLHDYCAICFKTLCDPCMATGCCEQTPAISGMETEPENLRDALSWVMEEDSIPSREQMQAWDVFTTDAVRAWAAATHRQSSDNDGVTIPEKPAVLR